MPRALDIAAAVLTFALLPQLTTAQPAPAGGTTPDTTTFIDIDLPLREGDVRVTGRTDATAVIVRVYGGWTTENGRQPSRSADSVRTQIAQAVEGGLRGLAETLTCLLDEPVSTAGPQAVTDGKFDVVLRQRLNSGDCVVVEQRKPSEPFRVSAVAESALLDFGRLRGYFSLGGAVSQNRASFSQVDTFVGFTTDSRVAGWVIRKPKDGEKEASPSSMQLRNFRFQANAFTDARVGFRLATTGATTASTATGGQTIVPPFQRPDQLTFSSDQPGYFQIGLHAPMSSAGMDWRSDGKLFSFFTGPIVKWGVQALDQPLVVARTVTIDKSKPETDNGRFTTVREESRRGALPFWAYGVRFGIYGYDLIGRAARHRQVTNDPIGYLDFTFGRARAYRSYQFTRTLNDAKTLETVTIDSHVRNRFSIEGRLKVPALPALVGIDVNVRGTDSDDEPNEFRFVLAFRVDAQKALGRVFQSDELSGHR